MDAAAGGDGQMLSAWAKSLGPTVIGTARSAAKCAVARAAGCDAATALHPAAQARSFTGAAVMLAD